LCLRLKGKTSRRSSSTGGAGALDIVEQHHIVRSYKFPISVGSCVRESSGALAEEQGHHPDILLGWGKVEITLWTHAVDGLTESILFWQRRSTN